MRKLKSSVSRPTIKTVVTGVEMFRKTLDEGRAGDDVGLLLEELNVRKWKEVRLWLNQVPLLRIQNMKLLFTY